MKNVKRKKQQFHNRRSHLASEVEEDLESARSRAIVGLHHMGNQRLSLERGGYDFQSWTNSLNLLLEDFEGKIGPDILGSDYHNKKREILILLPGTPDVSDLDKEANALRLEGTELRSKMTQERTTIIQRLGEINDEKGALAKELEVEKTKRDEQAAERRSSSLFSRLRGKQTPAIQAANSRIAELEANVESLESEAVKLRARRSSIERGSESGAGERDEELRRLDELDERMKTLETEREEKTQLLVKRMQVTDLMVEAISGLVLPSPGETDA